MKNQLLLKSAFTAFFAATICLGGLFKIPFGPIPIVLQNAICVLTGLLFGGFLSAAPTALFLLAGLIGFPVYSGGTGGLAVWAGPTGGFLWGYLLGALAAGLIAGRPALQPVSPAKDFLRVLSGSIVAMVLIYVPGVFHFARWAVNSSAFSQTAQQTQSVFAYTLSACVIPYLPGDCIKTVLIVVVALKVRPSIARYIYFNQSAKPAQEGQK